MDRVIKATMTGVDGYPVDFYTKSMPGDKAKDRLALLVEAGIEDLVIAPRGNKCVLKEIETIYTNTDRLYFKAGEDVWPANSITGTIFEHKGCEVTGACRMFECYGCGFLFSADHTDDIAGETEVRYTCQSCGWPEEPGVSDLIYLAAPYTHDEEDVMDRRRDQVVEATVNLTQGGRAVYSPVMYSTLLELSMGNGFDWYAHGLKMLRSCDRMIVLRLLGWTGSKGVKLEIEEARRLNIPISYMDWPPVPWEEDTNDDS